MLSFIILFFQRVDLGYYSETNHLYYKYLQVFSYINKIMLTNGTWIICIEKKYHIRKLVTCHWHILKTWGTPKRGPWNTSQDTDKGRGNHFLIKWTGNDLMHKYDLKKFTVCFEKPIPYNFHNITSWSVVLSPFWRSIRFMQVITPLSKPFRILLFKLEKQNSVESYFWKPDWWVYNQIFQFRKVLIIWSSIAFLVTLDIRYYVTFWLHKLQIGLPKNFAPSFRKLSFEASVNFKIVRTEFWETDTKINWSPWIMSL